MNTVTPAATPDAGVRRARPGDGPAVGAVHAASWLADYTGLLPMRAASVDPAALSEAWLLAITTPPTPLHRVMVATAGPVVVGFAAFGPSTDGDAQLSGDANHGDTNHGDTNHGATNHGHTHKRDAELVALLVDPSQQRRGHGSRLLSASVAALRENGFARLRVWVPEPDEVRRTFLVAAGFAPDGAARVLDAAGDGTTTVREVRLSAAITEP